MRGIVTREFTVWCGGCSAWDQTSDATSIATAARFFRADGWSKTEAWGWICNVCKRKAAKRSKALSLPLDTAAGAR